jgi:hypothetical protein
MGLLLMRPHSMWEWTALLSMLQQQQQQLLLLVRSSNMCLPLLGVLLPNGV